MPMQQDFEWSPEQQAMAREFALQPQGQWRTSFDGRTLWYRGRDVTKLVEDFLATILASND